MYQIGFNPYRLDNSRNSCFKSQITNFGWGFQINSYEIRRKLNMERNISIGNDLPDEYTGSNYTAKLKGTLAKAKANATQRILEMIEIASNKRFKENLSKKHEKNAKFGWYRYNSAFALPVFDNFGDILRYNVFRAELVIRYAEDNNLYLYDIINIKKETSTPLEQ